MARRRPVVITKEDHEKLREISAGALARCGFDEMTERMARSILEKGPTEPEQREAYVSAFFSVLMDKLLDARNKILAELRAGR